MNYLTTKEIVKEMNQVSKKIERKYEKLSKLSLKAAGINELSHLINMEIWTLETKMKNLSRNHKAKKESKK